MPPLPSSGSFALPEAGARVGYGITVGLNLKEKFRAKLRTVFSGVLRYDTVRKYAATFFCSAPYSSRRPNLKFPKGLLC